MAVAESFQGESEFESEPESTRELDVKAYVYLVLMVLIGSSTATAAKFVVRELPVSLLPIIRFGGAGLCLLPIVWRGGALARLLRDDWARLLLGAALCVPINQGFFLNATRLGTTSHVGLFYASVPLVVLVLARALGQERIGVEKMAGIFASVSGVAVIGLGNLWQGGTAGRESILGDLLLVGAVVSWGAYLTVNKPLVARHGALPVLAGTFLLGCLLDLPIALATLPSWAEMAGASTVAWCAVVYLTLVVTVFGLAFQNQALRRLEATQVATVGNAAPVLTVVWGVWLFQEPITPALLVGGALTLGGIIATSRPPRFPQRTAVAFKRRLVSSTSSSATS